MRLLPHIYRRAAFPHRATPVSLPLVLLLGHADVLSRLRLRREPSYRVTQKQSLYDFHRRGFEYFNWLWLVKKLQLFFNIVYAKGCSF